MFQRVGFSGSASVSLGPFPLSMGPSPSLPSSTLFLCREQLGWGAGPKVPPHTGQLKGGPTLSRSLLTVSCVEEQLHLLPQGPDHIPMAV